MTRRLSSVSLRVLLGLCATLAATCGAAFAQTEGRFSIGPQLTYHIPIEDDLDNSIGIGVSFSLTPPRTQSGWGPDFGFGWFNADLNNPLAGRLTIRPFLGGYGYTLVRGKVRYKAGALTGPGFVKIEVNDADRVAWSTALGIPVDGVDVKNTWIVKPAASVTYSVLPRVGIFGAVDYEVARLTLQVRTEGQTRERRLTADLVNLKVGINFGVF
jgi:hypothetical protein